MTNLNYPRLDETLFQTTLDNGLRVMVLPRKGFSRRIAYFVTDFGAIHTEFSLEGQTHRVSAGVAHYLEHKLFDMPGGRDVSAEFAAMGAMVNAFTSYDMTAYYFSCTENFSDCLRLLLEFVSTPYFTAESVEKERGIIDQEIGMNLDSPESCVYENLMSAAFENHPIRVPILGSRESIREITPQMLHLCHRGFYNPKNMLLCVVGDVDPDEVAAMAEQVLGSEQRPMAVKHNRWQESAHCPTPYCESRMEVAMPMFSLLFKCPAVPGGEQGAMWEFVADLAAEALFGESSRLYLELYEQGIIDSSFGGGFEVIDGCAMLMISGDSEDPAAVRDAVIARAKELVQEGIEEADFLRLRRSAFGRRVKNLDSFDSTCFRLSAYRFTDFDYLNFPAVYEGITPAALIRFLEAVIREDNCSLSVIRPLAEETEVQV